VKERKGKEGRQGRGTERKGGQLTQTPLNTVGWLYIDSVGLPVERR